MRGLGSGGVTTRPTYVLPLRWTGDDGRGAELTAYLAWLAARCDVVVVDGSPADLYERHHRDWSPHALVCRPDADLRCLNGKVHGVMTGVRRAHGEYVVIADDDVRYDEASWNAVITALGHADLVIPQNYFDPLPWHARWDTARSLINRAFGTDYPGTLALRRSAFTRAGGYDGDVLFENLELIRTLEVTGAVVRPELSIFVARRPPASRGFWSQRVRQAYDSLAQPGRLAAELALVPVMAAATSRGARPLLTTVAAGALAAVTAAEIGRRRAGGTSVYPRSSPLWAPAWVCERALCSWAALGLRLLRGGVPYAGTRLRVAAHSTAGLTRRSPVHGSCHPEHGSQPPCGGRRRTA
ncbi:glycosyltransferase family 2 protein [Phytoactinopolyspora alkaliphila]|uniref:Glycosyltransferase family 2 protein n=1 Tax=Phytoactinopolyspora alkaliphila TaxID=1783498 RepID=A0A6N9YNZ0_9ACTN|nr:glycosyltransferase [Phytoactinopolyspora alkaliphila]NED96549.1 glycosyltransferase family 2 protein [Phytoactinopolyspora alkaliphila]